MKKLRTIEIERLSVEQFKEAEKLPLVVVLDDVRSMYNVGSVFRTGDAFRIEAVYLCGITSTPPHTEIHKTALGAEDSVCWKYFIEFAGSDPAEVKRLRRLIRKAVDTYVKSNETDILSLRAINYDGIQWFWEKPCYYDTLHYSCDMVNDLNDNEDEQE